MRLSPPYAVPCAIRSIFPPALDNCDGGPTTGGRLSQIPRTRGFFPSQICLMITLGAPGGQIPSGPVKITACRLDLEAVDLFFSQLACLRYIPPPREAGSFFFFLTSLGAWFLVRLCELYMHLRNAAMRG